MNRNFKKDKPHMLGSVLGKMSNKWKRQLCGIHFVNRSRKIQLQAAIARRLAAQYLSTNFMLTDSCKTWCCAGRQPNDEIRLQSTALVGGSYSVNNSSPFFNSSQIVDICTIKHSTAPNRHFVYPYWWLCRRTVRIAVAVVATAFRRGGVEAT